MYIYIYTYILGLVGNAARFPLSGPGRCRHSVPCSPQQHSLRGSRDCGFHCDFYMSYSLNSLQGGYMGDYIIRGLL